MTYGYVSDIEGDETVMDTPEVTVLVNIGQLPPAQALAIAREAASDDLTDSQRGKLMKGEEIHDEHVEAVFHLPIGGALTALDAIDVVDLPEQPPTVDDSGVDDE